MTDPTKNPTPARLTGPITAAVLSVALTAHPSAQAQEKEKPTELPRITVADEGAAPIYAPTEATSAGKIALPIMLTPQAVAVVPEQLLEDFKPVTLDQALRTVSGVTQGNTFGGTQSSLIIRGFSVSGTEGKFRDGIPATGFRNSLTPSTERIEVLKGPSSLLYGSTAEPGGIINVISKRPDFQGSATNISVDFSDRGGNRANLDSTGPLGESFAYRLILDQDNFDYWRNFGEYDNTFIAPSLSWRSDKARVTAQYEYYDIIGPFDRGTVLVDGRIPSIPPTRRLGEPFEKLTEEIHFGSLNAELDVTDSTTLRFTGSYQDRESNNVQANPAGVVVLPTTGGVGLRRGADREIGVFEKLQYYSASIVQKLTTGPVRHEILFGIDYEDSDGGRKDARSGARETPATALDIFNPVYGRLDPNLTAPQVGAAFDQTGKTLGTYIQDVLSIGEQWTVLLGARYDDFERFNSFSGSATNPVPTDDSEGDTVLPRAGVVFQPRPWVSLYASYAESFQPNVFAPEALPAGGPQSFDPQEGISKEVGVKFQFGGINITAAAFDIEKENVLTRQNGLPILIDQATSEGFELDVSADLTDALSFRAAYGYTNTDDGTTGRPLVNAAENTIGLALSYRWMDGLLQGLSAGVSGQYVDDRNGGTFTPQGATAAVPFSLPSYTVADLFADYTLATPLMPVRLGLRVMNLFDEEYFPSSGGSLRINVGQARTYFGTVGVSF